MNPHSKRQLRRRRQHTKWRSKLLSNCRQLDCSPTTTRRSNRSEQSWTRQWRPVTSPCSSARGFEQARTRSPCMRETSKRPTIVCRRLSRASWLLRRAWSNTGALLKTSRRRCRSDGTTWNSYIDKLQPKRPTEPRPHSWKACSQTDSQSTCPKRRRAADLCEEERKAEAAAKEAAARPTKEAMELDEFGSLDDQDDPTPDQISVVTTIVNFWTTHAGPRHLVLGQEHRLEAGRCEEEAGKLERQGWLCSFSPAKRNPLKTKSESSLATSAGTFVAAPKHWELEWVWPARGWQSKELQTHQGRLTMAWVPIIQARSTCPML